MVKFLSIVEILAIYSPIRQSTIFYIMLILFVLLIEQLWNRCLLHWGLGQRPNGNYCFTTVGVQTVCSLRWYRKPEKAAMLSPVRSILPWFSSVLSLKSWWSNHPQRRYSVLPAVSCSETKWDFEWEICAQLPKGKDDISVLSYVNQLAVDDFCCSVSDTVHLLHPFHGAVGFQSFRDIFLFGKCGYKRLKHSLRLLIYFC